jgi:radical SAM protein with 4Fe4S-binding SPASM domain
MIERHGLEVDLQITNRCPLNCDHCVYDSHMGEGFGLTSEVIDSLCRDFQALGVEQVSITGGEPFIRRDLPDVIARLAAVGVEVCVQTSGLLVRSVDLRTLRRSGLSLLLVSIDGIEAHHDAFRHHGGLFRSACDTVRASVDADIPVRINTVVTRSNMGRVCELLPLARELGVTVFSFFYFSPLGRGALHSSEMLSFSEWRAFEQRVRQWSAAHPDNAMRIKLQSVSVPQSDLPSPGQRCRIADRNNILILANGDVFPCVFVCHERELCLGNIHTDSLTALWRSSSRWTSAYEPFFRIVGQDCAGGAPAASCNGGCPALRRLLKRDGGFCDSRCEWSTSGLVPGCAREYVPIASNGAARSFP